MGRVGGRSGHIYLRVAILTQGNSVPYFRPFLPLATRQSSVCFGLGCRWPPVGSKPWILRVAILTQGNSAPHGATRKQANLVLLGDREGDGRSSFDDAIVIDALSVLAQALSINSVDFTKLTALL